MIILKRFKETPKYHGIVIAWTNKWGWHAYRVSGGPFSIGSIHIGKLMIYW